MSDDKKRMTATDLIQLIRYDIQRTKSGGDTSLPIDKLETLLAAAEKEVGEGGSFMATAVKTCRAITPIQLGFVCRTKRVWPRTIQVCN